MVPSITQEIGIRVLSKAMVLKDIMRMKFIVDIFIKICVTEMVNLKLKRKNTREHSCKIGLKAKGFISMKMAMFMKVIF
jgi:hypothetical protein